MMNQNTMSSEFEKCQYHYLVAIKDREVMHKLLITNQELSKIFLENMIETFKKPDNDEKNEEELIKEAYQLKAFDSLFFSFHTFKITAIADKCTDFGLIHTDTEKSTEDLTKFVKSLDDGQYRKLTEVKKILW